jgi:3-oxoadipate enol-lactonase
MSRAVSEVVILSNALGTNRGMWQPQLPALEPRFRALRYEHRGRTSVGELAQDVVELMDASGVERASFCGLSLGGAVGMQLAVSAPERVERLVLACTTTRFPSGYRERAALVREQGTGPVVDLTLDRWFTPRFGDREPYRRMLLEAPREEYARCCEAIAAWDFRDRLPKIDTPTLVIAGAEDPVTTHEQAEEIAAGIPHARLVVLPEAAHLANVEQADAFNDMLLDALT